MQQGALSKLFSQFTMFLRLTLFLISIHTEEAKEHYPGYHSCSVPSNINYLRVVKKDDVEKKASA